jgi:hypothetical protein
MNAILSKNKDKYDANIENNLLLVQKSILAYADITRTKVLSDSSSLNADDYFTQGTDIISTLINVFDSNNKAIIADSKGWI